MKSITRFLMIPVSLILLAAQATGCTKMTLQRKAPALLVTQPTSPQSPLPVSTALPPGFAVMSGGGSTSGTGMVFHTSIGEPVGGTAVQTGTGMVVISNLTGTVQ